MSFAVRTPCKLLAVRQSPRVRCITGPVVRAESYPPFVFHEDYSIPWPEQHRFPMWKYRDLAEHLVERGLLPSMNSFTRPSGELEHSAALLAHDPDYYWAFVEDRLEPTLLRRMGFMQREDHAALVRCVRLGMAGMLQAAGLALEAGVAVNLTGGTHHAHRAWGSGYNVLNDLAITAKVLVESGRCRRVCVVDLDVHQGDGTAEICARDDRIFTFSLHCGENFPFGFRGLSHLGHDSSDLDVALPAGAADAEFLEALRRHLPCALEPRPDLVLYQAGVDIHSDDALGRFEVSDVGLAARDRLVMQTCFLERGVPVACALGGGYPRQRGAVGRRQLASRHASVCISAIEAWQQS